MAGLAGVWTWDGKLRRQSGDCTELKPLQLAGVEPPCIPGAGGSSTPDPATSMSSERLFSKAGVVIIKKRNSHQQKLIESGLPLTGVLYSMKFDQNAQN